MSTRQVGGQELKLVMRVVETGSNPCKFQDPGPGSPVDYYYSIYSELKRTFLWVVGRNTVLGLRGFILL